MRKELELWHFIHGRLNCGEDVMLLAVAESSGSSPGRAGYKMAVAADGELCGSIGGGVMEVNLVEQSRTALSSGRRVSTSREQIHRKDSENASGMICSGKQTVIFKLLTPVHTAATEVMIEAINGNRLNMLRITPGEFQVRDPVGNRRIHLEKLNAIEYVYEERLGFSEDLYIIGGGHCSLALSELMSKLGFRIGIFDDRPELNTLEKNTFAHEISIIDGYQTVGAQIPDGEDTYVVVMTLGYVSDKIVVKALCDRDFKYIGVLGSKAKMATLMKELEEEGVSPDRLARIRTPIGIPINSHTPEEIAVSIAAEIIAVKNGAEPTSLRSRKAVRNR